MKVRLRNHGTGLYYACGKHWVGDPGSALIMDSVEQATELSREESLEEVEAVVDHDDPTCELVLPIGRKKPAGELLRSAA
jgi:hypothetical protein